MYSKSVRLTLPRGHIALNLNVFAVFLSTCTLAEWLSTFPNKTEEKLIFPVNWYKNNDHFYSCVTMIKPLWDNLSLFPYSVVIQFSCSVFVDFSSCHCFIHSYFCTNAKPHYFYNLEMYHVIDHWKPSKVSPYIKAMWVF